MTEPFPTSASRSHCPGTFVHYRLLPGTLVSSNWFPSNLSFPPPPIFFFWNPHLFNSKEFENLMVYQNKEDIILRTNVYNMILSEQNMQKTVWIRFLKIYKYYRFKYIWIYVICTLYVYMYRCVRLWEEKGIKMLTWLFLVVGSWMLTFYINIYCYCNLEYNVMCSMLDSI